MSLTDLVTATLARARRDRGTPIDAHRVAIDSAALGPVGSICRVFFAHDPDPAGRCRDCGHTERKKLR